MMDIQNIWDNLDTQEAEQILELIEKNMEYDTKIIENIDLLIEKKHFSEYAYNILISIRNTYALNLMNIAKINNDINAAKNGFN